MGKRQGLRLIEQSVLPEFLVPAIWASVRFTFSAEPLFGSYKFNYDNGDGPVATEPLFPSETPALDWQSSLRENLGIPGLTVTGDYDTGLLMTFVGVSLTPTITENANTYNDDEGGAGNPVVVTITPVDSFVPEDTAYASGAQFGPFQTLEGAMKNAETTFTGSILRSLMVMQAGQTTVDNLELLLFNAQPSVSDNDGGVFSLSEAEFAEKCIGRISIATTDYKTFSNGVDHFGAFATFRNLNIPLKSQSRNIWAVPVISPTLGGGFAFVSVTLLKFAYLVEQL